MRPNSSLPYLFVYGTLLQQSNTRMSRFLARESTFVAKGFFPGALYEIGNYPGALFQPHASTVVHGSVLQLKASAETLRKLDAYEEVGASYPLPNEYVRQPIRIQTDTGASLECWVYLYNHSVKGKKQILSGTYQQFSKEEI